MYCIRVLWFLILSNNVWSDDLESLFLGARNYISEVFGCRPSITRVGNKNYNCKNYIILDDHFNNNQLDESKWILEQYIPSSPDYEFVSYRKDDGVIFQANGSLIIKPKLITAKEELEKKVLDLSVGCTRPRSSCTSEKFLMHNPIVSGRIVSKLAFAYGEVYVTARLPSGDWIYTEIYLEATNNQKLFIAYARGNKELTDNNGNYIGGRRLFGGPVLSDKEPHRSENLKSHIEGNYLSDTVHTYRLIWTQKQIELFIDNTSYGKIFADSTNSVFFVDQPQQVRLVLGVGVGGITDFPDGCKSGIYEKPWRNRERSQIKKFYEKKHEWYYNTWDANSQLQIDYVDIRSG